MAGPSERGGKTWWLILIIWTFAKKYPKSRWLILRNSYSTLQQTTLVTFQNLLDSGLANDVTEWKQQTLTATLYNGSQVFFMAESFDSDKELNRFKGLEINGAGVDEANEIQEATFNKVIERSGSWQHSKGCPIKILLTCNPTHNWVKQKFYDRWKNSTLPHGWSYVPARITDNPHIDPQYIQSLKLLPIYEYQSFVEGDWEVIPRTGGEFYKLFDYDKNTLSNPIINGLPLLYDPEAALHVTFDFNVNPYMSVGIWQVWGKRAIKIDNIAAKSPHNRTEAACKILISRYPGHDAGMFVYGDPSGMKEDTRTEKGHNDFIIIIRALSKYRPSLRVQPSAPPVVMRGNFINTCFANGYNKIELYVGQNCDESIKDYLYLKEASDGTKLKEKVKDPITQVTYEKYGHFSDGDDYFVCYVFQGDFVMYQKGGISSKITTGANRSKNSY